jgi:hypothetical protein
MIPIKKGKLDIATIKAWWMQFRDKSNYHLLGNNCCTVIYEALKRGGATKYASFPWNPVIGRLCPLCNHWLEIQSIILKVYFY